MALEPKDRDKLEKLLNMLGSDFEGERANAGGMIKKMADRYNVTPATLCLDNPSNPAAPQQPQQQRPQNDPFRGAGAWSRASQRRGGFGFSDFDFSQDEAEVNERAARMAREAEERQKEQQRQREEFHRRREEEIKEAGRRAAQERQRQEGRRKRKPYVGGYFGLLARLKGLYDSNFEKMEPYALDFIETVLDSCRADRMMTRRQRDYARALIKEYEEQEDPFI